MRPARFPRIAVVGRHGSPGLAEPLTQLARFLAQRGHEVVLDDETARALPPAGYHTTSADTLGAHADLAVVLGGDGTMLSVARRLAPLDVPLIGINLGRLGFLTDIPLAAMQPALEIMLAGRYVEEHRTLLDAVVERNGGAPEHALAVNDVAINRGSLGTMIDYAVEIDTRHAYFLRADGMIVATPTGSTAYALSAGGPILQPSVGAFALVPVAPHALTHRPIVVSDTVTIRVRIVHGRDAAAHCDGQTRFALDEGEAVTIRRASHAARFLHPDGYDHFAMLREKLHWSETPERRRPTSAGEPA